MLTVERFAAASWAAMVVVVLVLASQLREDSVDARVELAGTPAGTTSTYATQDYGPYYGPQAYYDGYYQTGGAAFASPYDRYERHREYRNYVGGYYWDNQQRTQAAQRQLRDQENWEYSTALQQWYDDYASQQQT